MGEQEWSGVEEVEPNRPAAAGGDGVRGIEAKDKWARRIGQAARAGAFGSVRFEKVAVDIGGGGIAEGKPEGSPDDVAGFAGREENGVAGGKVKAKTPALKAVHSASIVRAKGPADCV